MSNKNTIFYRGKQAISVDFSASEISSSGSLILLEKIEREHKIINNLSKYIPDSRNLKSVIFSREQQLKQRVFKIM